jgi:hypothetical protein
MHRNTSGAAFRIAKNIQDNPSESWNFGSMYAFIWWLTS